MQPSKYMCINSTAAILYRIFCLVATTTETSCIIWISTTIKIVISQPLKGKAISVQEVEVPRISRQLAHGGGKVVSLAHRPPLPPRRYSYLLEAQSIPGPMTPSGVKITQCLDQMHQCVPPSQALCLTIIINLPATKLAFGNHN